MHKSKGILLSFINLLEIALQRWGLLRLCCI